MLEKMEHRLNAEAVAEEFELLSMDAERVQRETLKKILVENGETEYLLKWGLNGKTDVNSFKACVPIVTHKNLEPYIQRIADGEKSSILTGKPISTISLSSGTTQGKPKYVPFNDALVESTMQMYKTSFAFRNREYPIGNGKALQFIYGSKEFKTKGGLRAGTATTNVYRNAEFKKTMKAMQTPVAAQTNRFLYIRAQHRPCLRTFEQVWQELVSDIREGSMEPYCKKLRHYGGDLALVSADYGSSEGWIGANVNPKLPPELVTFAVLPNNGYFEFIPLENGIEGCVEAEPVGLTEVEVGKEYEIIVTNFAGLYRYRLGDVVRVQGFHNSTPELQFVCRSNLVLNINIDKNTEKDLQLAVEAAAKVLAEEKMEVVDFTSSVDLSTEPGHYVIFWEISGKAKDEVLKECCNCLDTSFCDAGYVSSRKVNAIGALELRVLKRGTFHKIMDHYVGLGAAVSQFKTPRCVGPTNNRVLQILSENVVRSYFSTAF
ncbi:hypothetical protein DH2020_025210 [Rehmannia glutinosa]|uniref:Uncharacterized protein n=1 Tax=Rehmannia glutinosa TaxID=99300 RepID=A0ABR0W0H3_REHGL